MSTFMCWEANNEEPDDAEEIAAYDEQLAATRYIEKRWSDFDYPDESLVSVRDAHGVVTRWTVKAEPSVDFRAARAS